MSADDATEHCRVHNSLGPSVDLRRGCSLVGPSGAMPPPIPQVPFRFEKSHSEMVSVWPVRGSAAAR
jgi:hypothetical protein